MTLLYQKFSKTGNNCYHAKDATTVIQQISKARYQVYPCNNSDKSENVNAYNKLIGRREKKI